MVPKILGKYTEVTCNTTNMLQCIHVAGELKEMMNCKSGSFEKNQILHIYKYLHYHGLYHELYHELLGRGG